MKPDDVCGQEMDGEDWLPQQLFEGVGFLVLEARTPHGATAKGRVEGPHCPSTQQQAGHLCNQLSEECRKAEQVRRQMDLLWRNGIPMCIEASLYPQCPHGLAEARSIHTETGGAHGLTGGAHGLTSEENRVLLERWTIQVVPKRHADKPDLSVTPRFLLQAVRSFLHFSQLSAWLTSTQGSLPYPIAYRLFAPGDNVWDDFPQKADTHSFPQADVNQVTIQVSVQSIPRLPTIPKVSCRFASYDCAPAYSKLKTENGSTCRTSSESVRRKSSCYGEAAFGTDSKNNNNNSTCPRTDSVLDQQGAQSCSRSRSSAEVKSQSDTLKYEQNANRATQVLSAKPKVKLKPFDFTTPFVSKNPMKGHNLLTPAKRKDSPKVLFTSSANVSNAPPVYQKRFLDFDKSDSDSDGSDKTCAWDGLILTSRLQSMSSAFPARNSTEDLEAYLATIAERSLWREEQLKNIPIRKCKFFIGDKADDVLTPSEEEVPSLRLKETPKKTVKSDDDFEIDNLCKNLFKQTFQEILVDEKEMKKPSRNISNKARVAESYDSECISVCHTIQNSNDAQREVSRQSKSDFNSNSPVKGTSNICGSISMQTKKSPGARRVKRQQTVPNDFVESISERQSVHDNSVASNGANSQSVISNCAIVKPTSLSISRGREAPSGFAAQTKNGFTPDGNPTLHKPFLKKNFSHLDQPAGTLPSPAEISSFHHHLEKSTSMVFNTSTGLPSRSSPAPIKKKSSGKFDYDSSLTNSRAIKNAISCSKLSLKTDDKTDDSDHKSNQTLSTSAPASTNSLLGNFEESVLNGRIEPIGVVDGFTAEIGASGTFCPKHITLPVTSYFFSLSDDNAPSPYLGHINLDINKRRGYHVPKAGTVQVTLFNPNKTVVKMFVVRYDMSEMPSNCQTFLRQRTLYTPVNKEKNLDDTSQPSFLRYLIHLRFVSSKSGKIYLHTDIRLIFARDKFEFDPRVANYELRSFTEGPRNPKFSPKR